MSDRSGDENGERMLALVAQVISAYVGAQPVSADAVPQLIKDVHRAFATLQDAETAPMPAVSPRRSVFNDHLVCLEDGMSMKMLKRHLLKVHGMTPDEYRTKWSLPPDYPMVAPAYAKVRSALAKQSGLGRKPVDRPAPGATSKSTKPG